MTIEQLKNKKILILGYGIEGKATYDFLKKYCPRATVGIADQKDSPGSDDYLKKQADYDLVIKTPGIPKRLVTKPYTTGTNIFFANANRPIIGITGTKGKSTTTTLIYSILKEGDLNAYLIGNIGIPMLSELMTEKTDDAIYVCELSSYQLEDIEYSPYISVILNLFPEHMDYHGSFENYKTVKKRIIYHATSKDYFVYNPDYPELLELAKLTKAKGVPFVEELFFPTEIIPLRGEHNIENVRAAVTVARIIDVPDEAIEAAVRKFTPLPHRLEFVGNFRGIDFYDDAISTTPESTIMAINSIPNIQTIFLGGKDRGYDFSLLAGKIADSGIKNIVLFPESGAKMKPLLSHIPGIKLFETSDMKEAVKFAYENTKPGMACVLSTASPSYSVWKNFEEKGDLFKKFVKELGE